MDEVEQPSFTDLTDKELRRLSRFMLPGNPMRLAAKALIARDYEALNQPELYLSNLDSPIGPQFNQRLIAAEALKFAQLTADQHERLEPILHAIVSHKHLNPLAEFVARVANVARRYIVVYALIYVSITVSLPLLKAPPYDNVSAFILMVLSLLSLVCMFAIPLYSIGKDISRYRRLRSGCATALGRWGGPASIEPLIKMAEEQAFWIAAGHALQSVLKRLTADDYGKVNSNAVKLLSEKLGKTGFYTDLQTSVPLILDSLEKVGTGAGVAGVEHFVRYGNKDWREQAKRVLSVLTARQRLENDSARLLRPTVGIEKPDDLLRPASASDGTEEENLLRAVNKDS